MSEVHSPQGIRQSEQHLSPVLESATREVFELMLESKLEPLSATDTGMATELIAMVGLSGRLSGFVSVHCPAEAASRMAARMLHIANQAYDDTARDAVGEVCNMVAGSFKTKLGFNSDECRLTVPTIITGSACEMDTGPGGLHVKLPLRFDGSPICIVLDLRN